jgi:hypothetical protein
LTSSGITAYISTRNGPASFHRWDRTPATTPRATIRRPGYTIEAAEAEEKEEKEAKEESEELAAGPGGVGGDVRSLAGSGFSLADSGLYQDVVDEGCEVEHGGKECGRGRGSACGRR